MRGVKLMNKCQMSLHLEKFNYTSNSTYNHYPPVTVLSFWKGVILFFGA